MFAPPSGRYLLLALLVLVTITGADAIGVVPAPYPVAALLAVSAGAWGFLAWFFRDPERATGPGIVSAADGRVRSVVADGDRWQIAVFMNVTDVHVNRFPLDARVEAIDDGGSGHRPAYAVDADHNVRRHYRLATALGPVEVVQMTGIVARRLVSLVRAGDSKAKGDRLGMILLGSRVDVFLPRGRAEPSVQPGDRVRAGVTPIAREIP